MGGAAVLLLAGTGVLEWYWIALLAVASLGVGLYRLRATVPSKYKLAQIIDRRLRLADALSTATHFAREDAFGDPAIRARQREEADSIARGIDVHAAVPLARPRFLYAALALAAIAGGLFALRYAVTGSLNLQPSLVKIAFDTFFPQKQEVAQLQKKPSPKNPQSEGSDPDSPTTQNEQPPDSTLNPEDQSDSSDAQAADQSKDAAKQQAQSEPDQTPGDKADKGDKSQNGNDAASDADNSKDGKSGDQKNAQDSKQSSSENASLMDKLKDALANMMNKMKPSSSQNGSQSQQNAQKDAQGSQQKSNQ